MTAAAFSATQKPMMTTYIPQHIREHVEGHPTLDESTIEIDADGHVTAVMTPGPVVRSGDGYSAPPKRVSVCNIDSDLARPPFVADVPYNPNA